MLAVNGGVVLRFVTGQDFLGAFTQSQKALVNFIMSVRPSIRMFQRGRLYGLP
jgi:hypothetical protein